jgi:hypothetical protein
MFASIFMLGFGLEVETDSAQADMQLFVCSHTSVSYLYVH